MSEIKKIIKMIEEETMELADIVKLDLHRRNGLEKKFANVYAILESKPEEPDKKFAKIEIKSGVKKIS